MSKKLKVYYKGVKPKMSVALPIGCKSRSAIIGHISFLRGQSVEMDEADARLLCEQLDGYNFALEEQMESAIKHLEKKIEAVKPRRGRPRKQPEEVEQVVELTSDQEVELAN